jgi:hypothetical protein
VLEHIAADVHCELGTNPDPAERTAEIAEAENKGQGKKDERVIADSPEDVIRGVLVVFRKRIHDLSEHDKHRHGREPGDERRDCRDSWPPRREEEPVETAAVDEIASRIRHLLLV